MQTEKVIKRDNKYVLHTYARSRVVLSPVKLRLFI